MATETQLYTAILDLDKSLTSEIGASEDRLRADMAKMQYKLESDIAGLETSIGGLKSDMSRVIAWIESGRNS